MVHPFYNGAQELAAIIVVVCAIVLVFMLKKRDTLIVEDQIHGGWPPLTRPLPPPPPIPPPPERDPEIMKDQVRPERLHALVEIQKVNGNLLFPELPRRKRGL